MKNILLDGIGGFIIGYVLASVECPLWIIAVSVLGFVLLDFFPEKKIVS